MAGETTVVGSISIKVNVEDHTDAQMKLIRVNVRNALRAMAEATLQRAKMLAPVLTGSLRADGRIEPTEAGFDIVFGSEAVPYARRRHFENNLHPDTKYYLQNAGESVAKEGIKNYL